MKFCARAPAASCFSIFNDSLGRAPAILIETGRRLPQYWISVRAREASPRPIGRAADPIVCLVLIAPPGRSRAKTLARSSARSV